MRTVDYYFDFSSTNSYFSTFMLPELCRRNGAVVRWLPLHLAALFRGTGFDVMAMTPRKARYLWRDHARYAEATGLPFRRPRRFPMKTAMALRAVLAAAHAPAAQGANPGGLCAEAAGRLTQAVFRAYWERDEDIADRAVLARSIAASGLAADAILAASDSQTIRDELAAIVEQAIKRGVFGAPMFFVGDEMFWGKDRLDFVERWLQRTPPDQGDN
jgi:2-hydroxychromene-2-carboxylate isomerase